MSSKKVPQEPRLSASIVLINPANEVLLVERKPNASSFAGMHVFPGGNYDAKQDTNLNDCAVRELFEETGFMLCRRSSRTPTITRDALEAARKDVHAQRTTFSQVRDGLALSADGIELLPLSQWITPPTAPRRFHAHFFAVLLDAQADGDPVLHAVAPGGDGGAEVVRAHWVTPRAALDAQRDGSAMLMPPQYYILSLLARVFPGPAPRTPAQENVLRAIARGPFGRRVFNPRAAPPLEDGRAPLTYEGDEFRGGAKGARHRSVVRFGKGGIVTEIDLECNIDVTGVALPETSKL